MYELTVQGADGQITRIAFSGKRRLSELLQGVAGAPDYVCGGAGTCGKCRVLASGEKATFARHFLHLRQPGETGELSLEEIMLRTERRTYDDF